MNTRKISLIIAGIFLLSSSSFSQYEQGPGFKNRKPWLEEKENPKIAVSDKKVKRITGPAAKNKKLFDTGSQKENQEKSVVSNRTKRRVTGPAAKNRKPWDKN